MIPIQLKRKQTSEWRAKTTKGQRPRLNAGFPSSVLFPLLSFHSGHIKAINVSDWRTSQWEWEKRSMETGYEERVESGGKIRARGGIRMDLNLPVTVRLDGSFGITWVTSRSTDVWGPPQRFLSNRPARPLSSRMLKSSPAEFWMYSLGEDHWLSRAICQAVNWLRGRYSKAGLLTLIRS